MTQDVVNMHQLSQGVLEHFRDYVTDMNASRAQVDDTNRETVELLGRLTESSVQQAVHLAKLQEYQKALEAAGQQHAALTEKLIAGTQEQARLTEKAMEHASVQMRDSAKTLTAGYETFARQTQESLRKTTQSFEESMTASIRQMNETLSAMRETTRSMPQLLTQSRDRYSEQVDQFVTALVRLQKSMEKVSAATEAAAKRKE